MDDFRPTFRERFAAISRGKKVAGGLVVGAAALAAGAWAVFAGHGGPDPVPGAPAPAAPPAGPGPTGGPGRPDVTQVAPTPVALLQHGHPRPHRGRGHHPLGALLVPVPHRRPAHPPEVDLAVRRDIQRLLADVERARAGEPPLNGVALTAGLTIAGLALATAGAIVVARVSARTGFELGAYVAEALMARGIVAQMPDVPRVSAITADMTESDGIAAYQALVQAVDGPLDSAGLGALRDLKAASGITFWAAPGTAQKVAADVAAIRARRAGGKAGES